MFYHHFDLYPRVSDSEHYWKPHAHMIFLAWHCENSASNRSPYQAAINHYNFLLEKSKCNHYSNIVAENQGNPKALWNCFKKLLHKSSVAVLPDYTNKTDLANTFCKFFYDKILKIRSTLQSSIPSLVTRPNPTKKILCPISHLCLRKNYSKF